MHAHTEGSAPGSTVGPTVAMLAHDLGNHLQVAASALRLLSRGTAGPALDGRDLATTAADAVESAIRLGGFLVRQPGASHGGDVARPRDAFRAAEAWIAGGSAGGHPPVVEREVAGESLRVGCSPADLENAILNLVRNACDAMPHGGRLRLAARRAPSPQGRPSWVAVSVGDTGHGMSREVCERALTPYFTTKRPGRGTGLGLASVAAFARLNGGELDIASTPGEGTVVTIRLPLA